MDIKYTIVIFVKFIISVVTAVVITRPFASLVGSVGNQSIVAKRAEKCLWVFNSRRLKHLGGL